jgi:hypothetical protein
LIAPDGTRHDAGTVARASATTTTIDASSETANGTWRLEVSNGNFDAAEISDFALEFTP